MCGFPIKIVSKLKLQRVKCNFVIHIIPHIRLFIAHDKLFHFYTIYTIRSFAVSDSVVLIDSTISFENFPFHWDSVSFKREKKKIVHKKAHRKMRINLRIFFFSLSDLILCFCLVFSKKNPLSSKTNKHRIRNYKRTYKQLTSSNHTYTLNSSTLDVTVINLKQTATEEKK